MSALPAMDKSVAGVVAGRILGAEEGGVHVPRHEGWTPLQCRCLRRSQWPTGTVAQGMSWSWPGRPRRSRDGGWPRWPPLPGRLVRWPPSCSWRSWAARGPERPRLGLPARWRGGSPVGVPSPGPCWGVGDRVAGHGGGGVRRGRRRRPGPPRRDGAGPAQPGAAADGAVMGSVPLGEQASWGARGGRSVGMACRSQTAQPRRRRARSGGSSDR